MVPRSVPGATRPRLTIAALCCGTALSALNSGMVAVALATFRNDFAVTVTGVTWVITIYYLASAASQPIMGRLADRFGARRLFVIGMVIIMVTGALAPFSPTFWVLCVARVFFAIGMATAFPAAAAMLRGISLASGRTASTMIGRIQMVDTSTAAIGPVVGGLLITHLGWQAIFWINVPLATIALVSTVMLAPADGTRAKVSFGTTVSQSDVPGVLGFTVTIVALLLFLLGFPAEPRWWALPVAVVAGAVFVWRELRCTDPFIDLRLLVANTALLRVYVCFTLVNVVFYSALFGLPQYLEIDAGYRTDAVGALMIPLAAFTILLTPFVERLIDGRGLRFTLMIGGFGLVVATAVLTVLAFSTTAFVVLVVGAVLGVPYCVLIIGMTRSLYEAARPEEKGEAAGLFQTARCLGGITSMVVVGVSFSAGTTPAGWTVIAGVITVLAAVYVAVSLLWRPNVVAAP